MLFSLHFERGIFAWYFFHVQLVVSHIFLWFLGSSYTLHSHRLFPIPPPISPISFASLSSVLLFCLVFPPSALTYPVAGLLLFSSCACLFGGGVVAAGC